MSFTFDAPVKDPDSNLFYSMDWSDWLAAGETIVSQTVTAPAGGELDVDSVTRTGAVIRWRVTGGVNRKNYVITVRIVTSANQTEERSVRYRVRQL
jgi:hypothetical protein